ncbi:MAG: NAD-dependent epimerase/dehydratase family protein [Ardenticatenaceae bacterium]|nr:NAD-dependent epimerase/dehydratase family protein [Ardenticatenaceae bacterium]
MSQAGKQKILVTGGTGFTGSHLVKRLLGQGHEVLVVDNQPGYFYEELKALGANITIGSVTDRELMFHLVEGCDVIQHLAAAFRRIDLPKEVYWDVNVNGTRYLLEAAEKHGVKKFVYSSTCGVHGDVDNPPAPETAPITPADYYQFTKYKGEEVAQEFIERGLHVAILRPAAIYGPGDPERWLMLFKRVAPGRFLMFGNGRATYHPLYIDNLVDALILAAEKEESKGQTYLIADEKYYELNDLVEVIADVLNVDVSVIHLPFWPLWLAAVGCEAVCKPFNISPPLFRRRVDWFRQNRAFDISKAKRELGYQPKVDLKTGLSETAVWYRENNYL